MKYVSVYIVEAGRLHYFDVTTMVVIIFLVLVKPIKLNFLEYQEAIFYVNTGQNYGDMLIWKF